MSPPEMWQWIHMSYGDELGLTSSDDDYVPPTSYDDGAEGQEEEEECGDKIEVFIDVCNSLRANPLARSPGQVKQGSDK